MIRSEPHMRMLREAYDGIIDELALRAQVGYVGSGDTSPALIVEHGERTEKHNRMVRLVQLLEKNAASIAYPELDRVREVGEFWHPLPNGRQVAKRVLLHDAPGGVMAEAWYMLDVNTPEAKQTAILLDPMNLPYDPTEQEAVLLAIEEVHDAVTWVRKSV